MGLCSVEAGGVRRRPILPALRVERDYPPIWEKREVGALQGSRQQKVPSRFGAIKERGADRCGFNIGCCVEGAIRRALGGGGCRDDHRDRKERPRTGRRRRAGDMSMRERRSGESGGIMTIYSTEIYQTLSERKRLRLAPIVCTMYIGSCSIAAFDTML